MLQPNEIATASPRTASADGLEGYAQREWNANAAWLRAEMARWRTSPKRSRRPGSFRRWTASRKAANRRSWFAAWGRARELRHGARRAGVGWVPTVHLVQPLGLVR